MPKTPDPVAPAASPLALAGAFWMPCPGPAAPGLQVPLYLAQSCLAVRTQHLHYLLQEASLDCSMRPTGLPVLCTSSTLHVLLEGPGLASVSCTELADPEGVGCVSQ